MAEDRDIKIYIGKKAREANDFLQISEEIEQNRQNGNIEKAQLLGESLARVKPDSSELGLDCTNMAATELYCIRVLLTFTAEYIIQQSIKSEIISDAVSSAMYGYLKTAEPGYYDNISDGSAFTFYLLALKKNGDTARNIGEQFAGRCGTSRDEYIKLGAEIFRTASALFVEMINKVDFE